MVINKPSSTHFSAGNIIGLRKSRRSYRYTEQEIMNFRGMKNLMLPIELTYIVI
jgi:hypothetical protein